MSGEEFEQRLREGYRRTVERTTVDEIIRRIEEDDETCHAGSPRGLSDVNCMVPVSVVERILREVGVV